MPGPPNQCIVYCKANTDRKKKCAALDKYASGDASAQGSLLLVSVKSQQEGIDQFSAIRTLPNRHGCLFGGTLCCKERKSDCFPAFALDSNPSNGAVETMRNPSKPNKLMNILKLTPTLHPSFFSTSIGKEGMASHFWKCFCKPCNAPWLVQKFESQSPQKVITLLPFSVEAAAACKPPANARKCTQISEAGFCNHLWNNMQNYFVYGKERKSGR